MMLHQKIKTEIKQAMLAKEPVRLAVSRGLVAACTNELVARRRKPDEWLSDDETLTVIRRSVKQHQDSIDQFRAGGRADLVEQETAELKILKTYLPAASVGGSPEMDEKELKKLVQAKITALGAVSIKEAGKITGAVMKDLKGQADGALVKKIVLLSIRQ